MNKEAIKKYNDLVPLMNELNKIDSCRVHNFCSDMCGCGFYLDMKDCDRYIEVLILPSKYPTWKYIIFLKKRQSKYSHDTINDKVEYKTSTCEATEVEKEVSQLINNMEDLVNNAVITEKLAKNCICYLEQKGNSPKDIEEVIDYLFSHKEELLKEDGKND